MRMSYVLLAVVAIGCGGGGGDGYTTSPNPTPNPGPGTGATGSATVTMKSTDDGYGSSTFSFSPSTVTITKGGTVTWNNEAGTTAHNVTFTTSGAPNNIGNFSSGTSSRTFDATGTYAYHCTNHSSMTGTVKVE
jgi:plastocyanin